MKLETPCLQPLDDLVLLDFSSDDDVFSMFYADLWKLARGRLAKARTELLCKSLGYGSDTERA